MCSIQNICLLTKSFRSLVPRRSLQVITGHRSYSTVPNVSRKYTRDDVNQFKTMFFEFPRITQILDIKTDFSNLSKEYEKTFIPGWFEKSLSYNVNAGKLNRGQLTVIAYKLLADKSELTPDNIKLAQYVGWMSEMFEATLFIVDDIIDGSETRRSMPCWHTLPDVKMNSINDILMLENGTFMGLKKYIGHKDYYPRIFRMFSEALYMTSLGQTLDTIMAKENVTNQSMDRFESIIQYTTCYPAFYIPVAFAMEMCGYKDPKIYEDAKQVLYTIGLFFQSRNDYLDCFGDFEETGKGGTDIQGNKLSWMAVTAMARADSYQRKILETCYGQKDPHKVAQVLALYREMGIDQKFLEYEKESYGRINNMIQELSYDNVKPLLQMIWDLIYYKKSM